MTTITTNEWLAKARGLAALVEQHREDGERDRRLPEPVLAAACEAGLLRLLLPRALGGEQVALLDALPVVEELGRQDGSVGWNLAFAMLSPLFGEYLSEATAHSLFGGQPAVVAGSLAPRGRACPVAGGYRLSGRWSFVSGCQNASWHLGSAVVFEADRPVLGADGAPAPRLFLFPAAASAVIDTWRTTGMRGTGSHDIAVADLFVPEAYSFPFQACFSGPAPRPGLGYRRPLLELAPLFMAAVGLGIASAALEAFTALAAVKTPLGMTAPLAKQAPVQERVGRAAAALRAARSYLFETGRAVAAAPAGAPPLVLPVRLASAYAAQSANEAVNLLYQAAGGSAIYETSRLERCFRDCNTLTHHFMLAPGSFVVVGEWLLSQACA